MFHQKLSCMNVHLYLALNERLQEAGSLSRFGSISAKKFK